MRHLVLVAASLTFSVSAAAQETPPDAVATLTGCRSVTDPAARLACYDKAAAALETAREKKEIVVLDRAEVKKTRRSLFGFSLPRLKFLESDGKQEEPESEIETTVASWRSLGNGKWIIRTAEGAAWQTTEFLGDTPTNGAKVTIRRAALGSFFLKIAGSKAVRAARIG